MREPIIAWFKHVLTGDHVVVNATRTRELEMHTDVRMGIPEEVYARWSDYVEILRKMDPAALLKVVDATLSMEWYGRQPKPLNAALAASRSKWMVGTRTGKPGLMAREPEGVQDIVESAIAESGTAGQILARSWGKVHAFTPDDPGAYADAVRAVEISAQPLIEPASRGPMGRPRDLRSSC